jgi:xylulokinase
LVKEKDKPHRFHNLPRNPESEMTPMFLGLDASTQALKASLLTSTLDVRLECAVNFDADLPHYKTKGGVHHGPDGQVNSPVEMVIEAFDLLFGKMKDQGWPLEDIMGVAAAGQVSLL